MGQMKLPMTSDFFWNLDQEMPAHILKEYESVLRGRKGSTLVNWVRLLKANVPMPPRAYLTSAIQEYAAQKAPKEFLAELASVLERFEAIMGDSLGDQTRPLLVSVHGDLVGAVRNVG